jgi:DNA-binding transcriptional MerR regulator
VGILLKTILERSIINNTKLLKTGEVAKVFGVSPKTINAWSKQGKLIGQKDANGYMHYDPDEVYKLKGLRNSPLGNGIQFTACGQKREPSELLSAYIGNTINVALSKAVEDIGITLGDTLSPALVGEITNSLTEVMDSTTSMVLGKAFGYDVPNEVTPGNTQGITQGEELASDSGSEVEQLVMQLKKLVNYKELFSTNGLEIKDILPFLKCLKANKEYRGEEQTLLPAEDKKIEQLKEMLAEIKKGEPTQQFEDDDFSDL